MMAGSEQILASQHLSKNTTWADLNKLFTTTIEPERRPLEDRSQSWSTIPPNRDELELERQCFATAKLPWLNRHRAPKDDKLDMVINALMNAMKETHHSAPGHRSFKTPYNPHRDHHNSSRAISLSDEDSAKVAETKLRRRVLVALEQFPLCNLAELVACDRATWTRISDIIGGLNHALAVRNAQILMTTNKVRPVERAIHHAASCPRQRNVDRGRLMYV